MNWRPGSKEHAQAIERAVAGRNDLVWGAMQYGCRSCRHVEEIYCGVGVEGPPDLRGQGLYIASPFFGARCAKCGGETLHVNWKLDRNFEPKPPPPGSRYWRVPPGGIDMRYFCTVGFAGDLARAPA